MDNEALIRRWFAEVWNKGRSEAIDEMLDVHCVTNGLEQGGDGLTGFERFKAFHARFMGALPDMHIDVDQVVTSGDMTAARFSGWGTHAGDHLGVPATNKRVTFEGMTFARWSNGQIVEGWNCVNMLGLLSQVGAVKLLV